MCWPYNRIIINSCIYTLSRKKCKHLRTISVTQSITRSVAALLSRTLTSIIVLVNGLEPSNVIVRVCYQVHIYEVVVGLCAALHRTRKKKEEKCLINDNDEDDWLSSVNTVHTVEAITFQHFNTTTAQVQRIQLTSYPHVGADSFVPLWRLFGRAATG